LMLSIDDVVILNTQAQLLKSVGEFEKALQVLEEAMARFPNDVVTPCSYAEVLKTIGEFDKALAIYQETMVRFPNSEVARNGYAEILKITGEFDKALAIYRETMVRFPNDEVAPCGYAETLKAIGEFDRALAIYEETMKRFPNNEVAPNGYAEALKATGEFEKALAVYEETITRFPNNEVAPNGYAELLKTIGELERAIVIYGQNMARHRHDRVSRSGYASALVFLNRFEEARSLLSISAPKSIDDWIDYHIIAMSYLKQDNLDQAIAMFSFGLENAPLVHKKYFVTGLAVARIGKKQFDAAISVLQMNIQRIDIAQKETRLALMGHSQAALGKREKATELISALENTRNPRVIGLKDALSRRYGLGKRGQESLSPKEVSVLDLRIQEHEYFLAEAA